MDLFDDFLMANPGASYEDFVKMQNIMSQDIMAATLPQADMDMIDPLNLPESPQLASDVNFTPSCQPVIDMFGNPHLVDPMDVDIMSGIPTSEFHANAPIVGNSPSFEGSEVESYDQMRLDKGNEIEAMRDTAVQHYKDAKAAGDIDEMLKWEAEANKQQGRLYDHWGTPTYGLPPKAPGIS